MDASWVEGSSSSSLTKPPQWDYHVFVSFRGADTRKGFASHLFDALKRNGFDTFRDDKNLERGEFISDGLLKAIEGSRMSYILFSKNYAESRWCLDELVKIMDCRARETFKQIVVPIFYEMDPSDVRKQKGPVLEAAFAKHLREHSHDKVEKWRAALKDAGNLPGLELSQANGYEATLIKMIIKDVREKVNPTLLYVPNQQVGLEVRVGELKELLRLESDCVCIVAVSGMGGIGKTTIATRLYNDIQHKFERSGFLAKVRETSQPWNGLDELQKKLFSAVIKKTYQVSNFYEGIEVIKKTAFHGKKILLVLDDVDDVQQLKALAIDQDSFSPGSRIIITTRDTSSLNELKGYVKYEPKALNKDESLKLFSWHAFKEHHPPKDYLNLSGQVLCYAEGLPLAIEVLGSSLRGRHVAQWESAIARLRAIPNNRVRGQLKLSYDSLSDDLKELFLDMACFFVGTDRDSITKVLEHCQKYAECGIQDLTDRCLIKYDSENHIVMHDMLRDMGRDIVKQESHDDPGKRSRLWCHKDVLEVLKDGTGTKTVKGLILNATKVQENARQKMNRFPYHENIFEGGRDGRGIEAVEGGDPKYYDPVDIQVNGNAFKKMDKLWLLHLDYCHITAGYEQISKKLMWLSWKGFPLECIPHNLSMEELVALDLRCSSLKILWFEHKTLRHLKLLYLSHCHYLTKTPNFFGLCSLEELLLDDCKSLVEVDDSIRYLDKLRVLDMKGCTNLQKLPSGILMLKSLECLDLSGCSKLEDLHGYKVLSKGVDSIGSSLIPIQASSCLTKLNLNSCHLSYLTAGIGNLNSLQNLNLGNNNLSSFPDCFFNLTCLKHLYLKNNNVSYLPSGIGRLTSLERLDLSGNSLCTLPDTIGKLSYLKNLQLADNKLSYLPCEIGDLDSLEILDLEYNRLATLPDRFCALTRLFDLSLEGCKLSHLPSGMGRMVSLQFLNLGKTNISTLPESLSDLPSLHHTLMGRCAKLRSLPKLPACIVFAGDCPSLESVPLELDQIRKGLICPDSYILAENNFVSSLLEQLPKSKGLSKLQDGVEIRVPAGGDIPSLFPYEGRGSNVSFVVPPSIKQKMLGWILRVLFKGGVRIARVIYNRIEKRLSIPGFFFNGSDNQDLVWLLYIPQGYVGLQLQGGDEVEIPLELDGDPMTVVKSWAIDLIYKADDENRGDGILNQLVSI